jgi:DNA primase
VTTGAASADIAAAIETALLARAGKHSGDELKALCPFHDDTAPSLDWNSSKHVFLCRSCGEKGGWKKLAKALGVEPPPDRPVRRRVPRQEQRR